MTRAMRRDAVCDRDEDPEAVTNACALWIALLGGAYSIGTIAFVIYSQRVVPQPSAP